MYCIFYNLLLYIDKVINSAEKFNSCNSMHCTRPSSHSYQPQRCDQLDDSTHSHMSGMIWHIYGTYIKITPLHSLVKVGSLRQYVASEEKQHLLRDDSNSKVQLLFTGLRMLLITVTF